MIRRRLLLVAPVGLASCALSQRPYAERRAWPLDIRRPTALPARARGKVLLVRAVRPGPGLEARGLQSIEADGSIRTGFYEEWSVPPAQATEDGLRRWLADSGRFAAVLAPGSRASADLVLEGELTALWTDQVHSEARAALAITVIEAHGDTGGIRLQREFHTRVPTPTPDTPSGDVATMREALARIFGEIEAALAVTGA